MEFIGLCDKEKNHDHLHILFNIFIMLLGKGTSNEGSSGNAQRHRENIFCSSLTEILLILGFSLWVFNDNGLKKIQ